jgi:high-affinity iron transporter
MAAFADLSDDQRWALAVHVAGLADDAAARARGAALWAQGRGRAVIGDLGSLVTVTAAEIRARHGEDGVAVLAALREDPARLVPAGGQAIAISSRLLAESLEAYRRSRAREAQDLAVASYLEGFEPVEAALDARDRPLRGLVEQEMIRYRTLLRDGAPPADVEAQAQRIQDLLGEAQRLLAGRGLAAGPAFVSAFVILLREGLEAVLIVAAIVAMLVRAGRRDALPAVHTGWLAALALGVVTWGVAAYVVTISGATREVTEGITALAAAGILLWVGFWMHDKSHAQRWRAYLQSRLQGALGRRGVWGLALVSFLAVYREVFETVLFAQALWLQVQPGSRYALVGGLGAASVALGVASWLIVRGSLRLPLGAFFGISSMALASLAIVLAGKGVAALEEAGYLAPRPIDVPSLPLLGVYPDLLGLALQAALTIVVVGGFAWRSRALRRAG